MARKPKKSSSFCKVLIGDFVNKLRIPPAFVKNFEGNVPARFTLKSNSGCSWQVTVLDKEGSYVFCGGWSNFVKDQSLETGDFIVFNLLGRSTFDSVIYTRTGCEKKIVITGKRKRGRPTLNRLNEVTPSEIRASSSQNARGAPPGRRITRAAARRAIKVNQPSEVLSDSEAISEHSSVVVILKKYQKWSVAIPRTFAKEAGLARKRSTVIKDPKGRAWPMSVVLTTSGRVWLGAGWSSFLRENRIVAGDTLLFRHIRGSSNVIYVQIAGKAGDEGSGR